MNSDNAISSTKRNEILTITFPGQWFLLDSKIKVFIDGKLHSVHSIKNGFSISIPITSDEIKIQVVLGGMRSTIYNLNGFEIGSNYTMMLIYNTVLGKFGKEYKLLKEEELQIAPKDIDVIVPIDNSKVNIPLPKISAPSTMPTAINKPKRPYTKTRLIIVGVILTMILYTLVKGPGTICGLYLPKSDGMFIRIHGDGTICQGDGSSLERWGTYKFDKENKILYINFNDGIGPNSVHVINRDFTWVLEWGEDEYEQKSHY